MWDGLHDPPQFDPQTEALDPTRIPTERAGSPQRTLPKSALLAHRLCTLRDALLERVVRRDRRHRDVSLGAGLDHIDNFFRDLWLWHIHDVLRLLPCEEVPQLRHPACTRATARVRARQSGRQQLLPKRQDSMRETTDQRI